MAVKWIHVTDTTLNNPDDILYIKGDANTDGSIRFMFTEGDSTAHLELRANGVWNDTGLRFSSSSVLIGRDLILSGAAGFIETRNPSGIVGHIRSLVPHIQFDDDGTSQPQTPIVNEEEDFDVYTTAVSEIIGTTIGINLGVSPGRLLEESKHEVGSIGATAPIQVNLYDGTDNTGFLIDRRMLPTSAMPANTTLEIKYDNDMGFQAGEQVFMEFVSDANISLLTDAGGNPITVHEGHQLGTLELLTENLMLDESLDFMFDTNLNPMYAIQFP